MEDKKNIPKKIYLQVPEEGDFNEMETTWCSDRINDEDIEYVLAINPRPSDSDIEKQSNMIHYPYSDSPKSDGYIAGAKWMRDRMNGEMLEMVNFLNAHEQWEADFISENKVWWPNRATDVLGGELYESWMKLQAERNKLLQKFRNRDL